MTETALALDITVGQEGVVGRAVGLGGLALLDEAVLPETSKDALDDGGMLVGGSAAEDVELDSKPIVDVLVDGVILGAQCRRIHALGERLCLGRGAVLIRTTDINRWETPRLAKASKNVGRLRGLVSDSKYAAQVAQSRRNRDAWRGRRGGM